MNLFIDELINMFLVILIILTVTMVSRRNLISLINSYAFHSLSLSLVSFLFFLKDLDLIFLYTAVLTIISKSYLIPVLLKRTQKNMKIYTDVEYHYLQPISSIFFSLLVIISAFFIFLEIKDYLDFVFSSYLGLVMGFSLVMIGFMIIFSRIKIITKIIGYLIMENGVVLLSLFIGEMPLLIEVLILMDLLVLVAITAILGFGMDSSLEDFHKRLNPFRKWFKKVVKE